MTGTASPAAPMRALFLNENIGGHATVHHNLARSLTPRSDVSATFLNVPPRGLARRLFDQPIPYLDRLDLDGQPLRSQLGTSMFGRRLLNRELAAGPADSYDVLHVYTQNVGLLSARMLRSRPTVVTTDSTAALNAYRLPYRPSGRFTPQSVRLSQRFERRVLAAATLIIANTRWVADALSEVGVPRDRIRIIPFGVELPPVAPRVAVDRPRITFIGYTLARKGGHHLLELHQAELIDDCDLVLVTTDHVEAAPGVIVRNDVRPGDGKLEGILGSTAVMVLPSVIDQAPNAVLEAMAFGVPVIAYRVGGIPEMVEDGVTGFLVDPDDDAGLVRAIRALVTDPARAAEMGAAAREEASRRYDMAISADALVAVLREAMTTYDRRGPIG